MSLAERLHVAAVDMIFDEFFKRRHARICDKGFPLRSSFLIAEQ